MSNMGFWEVSFLSLYFASILIVLFYIKNSKQSYLFLLLPIFLGPLGLLIYYFKYK